MSSLSIRDALKILQLPPSANMEEIPVAWRNRLQAVHPDRNPNGPEVARRQFDEVQEAYQKLTEPDVVKLRGLAYARGPAAPFVPGELEAFRALGLGPSASFDDIDDRVAELIATDAKGDWRGYQEVLCGKHRRARKSLGLEDEDDDPFNLHVAVDARRRASTPNRQKGSPTSAVLFALIGIGLAITTAVLVTKSNVSVNVELLTLLMAVACFVAAVLKAFRP